MKVDLHFEVEIDGFDIRMFKNLVRSTEKRILATKSPAVELMYQRRLKAFKTALHALEELFKLKQITNGKIN